jgi:cytochrome c peroxidase
MLPISGKWILRILSVAAAFSAISVAAYSPPENDPVELGRQLFFDTRLSADRSLSCSSCHIPERGFADGRAKAVGIHGAEGERNSPTLINVGSSTTFFWDGRESVLERQTLAPIFNPKELGLNSEELERRIGKPSTEVAAALASYVRTIRSSGSRFDRFLAGDTSALNAQERSGFQLFRGRGRCVECHEGPDFTDDRFHNTGIAWKTDHFIDDGRFAISRIFADRGAFRTPTLREIERTAPYMHDGSLGTLEDVVNFYVIGGRRNPTLDPRIRPLDFNSDEKRALVAFLKTLSGTIRHGS